MTDVLPNAVVLVDDFIAATEHSFRIKFQFCQMRRDVFVFLHDVDFLPTLEGLWLKCRVGDCPDPEFRTSRRHKNSTFHKVQKTFPYNQHWNEIIPTAPLCPFYLFGILCFRLELRSPHDANRKSAIFLLFL